jgi:hypothetical protein
LTTRKITEVSDDATVESFRRALVERAKLGAVPLLDHLLDNNCRPQSDAGMALIAPSTAVQHSASRESMPFRESKFGRINLTIRYSTLRGHLVIVIHECRNLIPCDKDNLADPYVRVYLLPDRSSATKKRTKMIKNDLNPEFDETLEWPMSADDAARRKLDIAIKNDVTLFSKSRTDMGSVIVDLSKIADLTQATNAWYDLNDAGAQ